jgi:hypothetical protein
MGSHYGLKIAESSSVSSAPKDELFFNSLASNIKGYYVAKTTKGKTTISFRDPRVQT